MTDFIFILGYIIAIGACASGVIIINHFCKTGFFKEYLEKRADLKLKTLEFEREKLRLADEANSKQLELEREKMKLEDAAKCKHVWKIHAQGEITSPIFGQGSHGLVYTLKCEKCGDVTWRKFNLHEQFKT